MKERSKSVNNAMNRQQILYSQGSLALFVTDCLELVYTASKVKHHLNILLEKQRSFPNMKLFLLHF